MNAPHMDQCNCPVMNGYYQFPVITYPTVYPGAYPWPDTGTAIYTFTPNMAGQTV